MKALNWHDEAEFLGLRVRAFFFDSTDAMSALAQNQRLLPVFEDACPALIATQGGHPTYQVEALMAHPDALFNHGDGLICLSYKGNDGRLFNPQHWVGQCRVDVLLQGVATAMAVSGHCQKPTAALWRGVNVLCQIDPSPPVLECLADNIESARQYWCEPDHINPAQLARYCEPRLRATPGLHTPRAAFA